MTIPASATPKLLHMFREFLRLETAAGFVLVAAAVLALLIVNLGGVGLYHAILEDTHFTIGFLNDIAGLDLTLQKSVLHWINDGLMVIFFFLVGLEIKREFKVGDLSTRDRALLPFLAAAGGMAAPAVIFSLITLPVPHLMHGWAIASATDIAFTLGVLALLGPRVPLSLKILVTAIAVIDDLGAIIIIALFYGGGVYLPALAIAGVALAVLLAFNQMGVVRPAAYILVGFVLWLAILKSGMHATLAGVITAMCIPMRDPAHPNRSPVERLEHTLHPWVAFLVLPIFAFANAGVSLSGITLGTLGDPVVMGITLGLFLGKQLGIFGVLWLAIRAGLAPMPAGATWPQIYGVSILCGIGFTMSLFIGGLAYADPGLQVQVRVGVMLGSLLSAVAGYMLLARLSNR